jgi:hypothetical protein
MSATPTTTFLYVATTVQRSGSLRKISETIRPLADH